MNAIDLQSVEKRYGTFIALQELNLAVRPGEVVAMLGPNGAGKTTAISIMLGLKRPSKGRVRLFGQDPESRQVRGRVGVMLQESGVPEHLSAEELVRLFTRYYPFNLPVEEVLERAELLEKRRALVRQLSGGQKQRLYFALALAGDPDLIFLDEPTVGMDVEARREFWRQVQGFADLGKTILFCTHYLEEADAVAHRVVVIHQGRVLADGSPREIKRLVAAKTVRMQSTLSVEEAVRYTGVERAEIDQGYLKIYTNQPEVFLRQVFQEDLTVNDLTVNDTDLETAFVGLTHQSDEGRGREA